MTDQSKAQWKKAAWIIGIIAVLAVVAWQGWQYLQAQKGKNIASANGRIEATEVNIAAKYAGRIAKEFVDEGDYVTTGRGGGEDGHRRAPGGTA